MSPSPVPLPADAETIAYADTEIVNTYGLPQAEYAAVRKNVAVMDAPQRGVLELVGRDRLSFLNNQITNEIFSKQTKTGLTAGQSVYAFYLNLKGRVVCDLVVSELGDRTLVETDARLIPMLRATLDRYLFSEDVKLIDRTTDTHVIALHGPTALAIFDSVFRPSNKLMSRERNERLLTANAVESFAFQDVVVIARRDDVCNVPGLHLIVPTSHAAALWDALTSVGAKPLGWAAFNTARIEAGRPLFGIDFELAPPSLPGKKPSDAEIEQPKAAGVLPAETSLFEQAVSVTKGCYLGQEIVARMHARKAFARKLVGLRVGEEALPVAGTIVYDAADNEIGVVTSSTMSPLLGDAAVALALLRKPHFDPGKVVRVPAEGKIRDARVVLLPFVR